MRGRLGRTRARGYWDGCLTVAGEQYSVTEVQAAKYMGHLWL